MMGLAADPQFYFRPPVTDTHNRHCNATVWNRSGCCVIPDFRCVGRSRRKNKVLPARLELAIFGLLLEYQAHVFYETDALPTEPRKHYTRSCYDHFIPFRKFLHPQSVTANTTNRGRDDTRIRKKDLRDIEVRSGGSERCF